MVQVRHVASLLLVCVCVLAGCSGDDPDAGVPSQPSSATASTPSAAMPSSDAGLEAKIAEAIRLVERDHGVDPAELEVVTAERVSWPDSSYGCPRGEQTYEPGPFPGFRVVLAHGKRDFTYLGGEDSELRECLFLE